MIFLAEEWNWSSWKRLPVDEKLDLELVINENSRLYIVGREIGDEDKEAEGVQRRIENKC